MGCKTCLSDKSCTESEDGYYVDGGSVAQCKLYIKNGGKLIKKHIFLECNHNICATCSSPTVCIISCLSNCSTCNVSNECVLADDGYYVDGSNLP